MGKAFDDEMEADFYSRLKTGGEYRDQVLEFWEKHLAKDLKGPNGKTFYTEMWALVRYVNDRGLELEFKRRIDPIVGKGIVTDTRANDALRNEVMGAFTEELSRKSNEIDNVLRGGGEEAISAFMRMVTNRHKKEGMKGLSNVAMEWYALLPERERNIVLLAGIEALIVAGEADGYDAGMKTDEKPKYVEIEPKGRLWHMGRSLFGKK